MKKITVHILFILITCFMVWGKKDDFIRIKYNVYAKINSGYAAFYTYMKSGSHYRKEYSFDDDDYNDFDD